MSNFLGEFKARYDSPDNSLDIQATSSTQM